MWGLAKNWGPSQTKAYLWVLLGRLILTDWLQVCEGGRGNATQRATLQILSKWKPVAAPTTTTTTTKWTQISRAFRRSHDDATRPRSSRAASVPYQITPLPLSFSETPTTERVVVICSLNQFEFTALESLSQLISMAPSANQHPVQTYELLTLALLVNDKQNYATNVCLRSSYSCPLWFWHIKGCQKKSFSSTMLTLIISSYINQYFASPGP